MRPPLCSWCQCIMLRTGDSPCPTRLEVPSPARPEVPESTRRSFPASRTPAQAGKASRGAGAQQLCAPREPAHVGWEWFAHERVRGRAEDAAGSLTPPPRFNSPLKIGDDPGSEELPPAVPQIPVQSGHGERSPELCEGRGVVTPARDFGFPGAIPLEGGPCVCVCVCASLAHFSGTRTAPSGKSTPSSLRGATGGQHPASSTPPGVTAGQHPSVRPPIRLSVHLSALHPAAATPRCQARPQRAAPFPRRAPGPAEKRLRRAGGAGEPLLPRPRRQLGRAPAGRALRAFCAAFARGEPPGAPCGALGTGTLAGCGPGSGELGSGTRGCGRPHAAGPPPAARHQASLRGTFPPGLRAPGGTARHGGLPPGSGAPPRGS